MSGDAAIRNSKQGGVEGTGTEDDPIIVRLTDRDNAKRIRIIHISDTHLNHDMYLPDIPNGDVLVHSGDFSHFAISRFIRRNNDYATELSQINTFFAKLPHKHKIFIAGNHEMNFQQHSPRKTQALLTEVIYLQDSSVTIEGLKFYGSPWNGLRRSSFARGFTVPYTELDSHWALIPEDTDVLITHQPPQNILDGGGHLRTKNGESKCLYLGCEYLREHVLERVRPLLHCFGHYHGGNGAIRLPDNDTLFSNAAMKVHARPKVIDIYVNPPFYDNLDVTYYTEPSSKNGCLIS